MPSTQLLGRKFSNGEKEKLELESTVLHERNVARLIGLLQDPRQSLDLLTNISKAKPKAFQNELEQKIQELRDTDYSDIDHPEVFIAAQVRTAFEDAREHDEHYSTTGCGNDSQAPQTVHQTSFQVERTLVTDQEDDLLQQLQQQLQTLDFWASLTEALHLEVAATTTRTWGRKKMYEVYQLAGPVTPITKKPLAVAATMEEEFFKAFQAHVDYSEELFAVRHTRCRTYITQHQGAVWIQINIGDYDDPADALKINKQGRKVRKRDLQYIAVVRPESSLIALTASRRPSTGRFTQVILAALENTLTCSAAKFDNSKIHRIGDLHGTEPLDLLKEAMDIKNRALGRFAEYDRAGKSYNPVQELHKAASSSLLLRQDEERLATSAKYGRHASNLAEATKAKNALLLATSKTGYCIVHNQKRSAEAAFANTPPSQTLIQWDWKGVFEEQDLECRVTVHGKDVFAGMRAMVDAGLMDANALPHWVRDAPLLGRRIRVQDGHVMVRE